jgi:hypothetical protein
MSTRSKLPGAIVTTLAAVALAAPGAGAMPLHEASEFDAGHAAVATAAAKHQDLRSADAKDAAMHPQAIQVGRGSRVSIRPTGPAPVQAVAPTPAKNDDGLPWLTIVLGVAGGLAVGGAAAGITHTTRARARAVA